MVMVMHVAIDMGCGRGNGATVAESVAMRIDATAAVRWRKEAVMASATRSTVDEAVGIRGGGEEGGRVRVEWTLTYGCWLQMATDGATKMTADQRWRLKQGLWMEIVMVIRTEQSIRAVVSKPLLP